MKSIKDSIASFARIPAYVKFALAVLIISTAASVTSCCPPGGGPGNGGEPGDSVIVFSH